MEVAFDDETLDRLETEAAFNGGFGDPAVKAFRKRLQQIRAAQDERTFHSLRSLNFEKLKGDREGQHSMRLNDQWRLIVKLEGKVPNKVVRIVEIADYH